MNDKQALRILIKETKKRRQEYAFNANLYKRGHTGPRFVSDHEYYEQLTEAIAWAEKKLEDSEA